MYVNAVSLYKTLEWLCIRVAVTCIIQKDPTGVCMSKPISFCIDEWKQFNRIPSKENGAHFELTRFLFVYFAKCRRGEISHATLLTLSSTDMSNQTVFQGHIWLLQIEVENAFEKSTKSMKKWPIMDLSSETFVLQSSPGFANEKKMPFSAIAHIWKWTWKSGGCCQEGKLLGKKSKEVLGGNFPYWFFLLSGQEKRSASVKKWKLFVFKKSGKALKVC